jgi:tripartite motif-containing protein 71
MSEHATSRKNLFIFMLMLCVTAGAGYFYYIQNIASDSGYEFVTSWGTKGTQDGNFLYVEDFALDAQGNILVTDALRSDVQVFTPDGQFITKFAGKGDQPQHLEKPEGISIDKDGNIYVADSANFRIQKFAPNSKE